MKTSGSSTLAPSKTTAPVKKASVSKMNPPVRRTSRRLAQLNYTARRTNVNTKRPRDADAHPPTRDSSMPIKRGNRKKIDPETKKSKKKRDGPLPSIQPTNNTDLNSINNNSQPRSNILTWEEYFMSLAFLSAQRSKDPVTQVGACIVNKRNQIVGIGYNGMPRGCPEIWGKDEEDPLKNKILYVCHAEMNAILNKNSADVSGCTIYVALFPCNECAKLIIQAGINKIVYFSDKKENEPSNIASKSMLDETDVKYRPFVVWGRRELTLDFNAVEAEFPDSDLSGQAPEGRADNGSANDNQEGRIESQGLPISWEEYFMAVAFLSAQRCKDPLSQVGACIVNADKRIVAIGYNGMPCGCRDENMPWQDSDSESSYMCHAELTAIMNKNGTDVRGCTMYVTLFPCPNCTKLISQAGLSKVVYYTKDVNRPVYEEIASRNILRNAEVFVTQFSMENPTARTRIAINFESINR